MLGLHCPPSRSHACTPAVLCCAVPGSLSTSPAGATTTSHAAAAAAEAEKPSDHGLVQQQRQQQLVAQLVAAQLQACRHRRLCSSTGSHSMVGCTGARCRVSWSLAALWSCKASATLARRYGASPGVPHATYKRTLFLFMLERVPPPV